MTINYLDPYKDNPFGKLKGDKATSYFKVTFTEAKFYKYENAYILAGQFESYMGIERSYKPELSLEAGLCELPIYGSAYEVRQKKVGTGGQGSRPEYETITLQPSVAEKLLYQHIEDNSDSYLDNEKAFKGEITFYPDDNYASMPNDEAKMIHVLGNTKIETIEPSGQYPDWIAPKPFSKGSYKDNQIGLEEKLTFLKNELAETVNDHTIRSNKTLPIAAYIHKILDENTDNERFLVAYFDLIRALIN